VEVKEAKKACAKTQQEIDAQESKLERAIQERKFEGAGGAGETQRSIDVLKRRLDTEKATVIVQSNIATKAIKDLAKQWVAFNKALSEQMAQTEKSMEAAKKKSTPESFAKLSMLQMHLDRVKKAKQEVDALKAKPKTKTLKAGHDILQKLEQLRLSIAGGPKTQDELAKQPIDFGILSQRMDRDSASSGSAGKFVVGKLITGRPEEAAHGLAVYMGIDAQRQGQILQDGLKTQGDPDRVRGERQQSRHQNHGIYLG
jgi:hypothetical protein